MKFESGTGWPSFNDPVDGSVEKSADTSYGMMRTKCLQSLRQPSRPCVRGRPAADRLALLHQWRRVEVPAGVTVPLSAEDLRALRAAVLALEHPGLPARLAGMVGKPLDLLAMTLPPGARQVISAATQKGLEAALKVAVLTMKDAPGEGSRLLHKSLAVASGAFGGAFGLTTLPIELPVSTIIMLRSIADIARSEGENLHDPDAALSCLQVFALGGGAPGDDAAESTYFVMRGILAKSTAEAVRYIAERGIVEESAPLLVRFLTQIAARFGVVVTQKFAAQMVRNRRVRRRGDQLRIHRSFSGCRTWPLHRAPAGARLRQGRGASGIRSHSC